MAPVKGLFSAQRTTGVVEKSQTLEDEVSRKYEAIEITGNGKKKRKGDLMKMRIFFASRREEIWTEWNV